MVFARDKRASFPHISFRDIAGKLEAYLHGTGLAIWEVALLARGYGNDADAIARHTLADCTLIEEGLRYIARHKAETDAEIDQHTANSPEDLQRKVPGLRLLVIDRDEPGESSP